MHEKSSTGSVDMSPDDYPSKCPACGSSAVDTVIPSIGPICGDCGAVTTATSETLSLAPTNERTEKTGSWSDYHTVTNSTEQRMAESFDILETIAEDLGLGRDTRERSAEVYAEAAIANLPDGRPTELTVGAAIVHGTRAGGEPRPSGCIAKAADVDPDALNRIAGLLSRELDRPISFCPPEEYLAYLSKELRLDTSAVTEAKRILGEIEGPVLAGKDPVGFAGATLYLAAGGNVTQRKIAGTAGITTETLRVRVRDCRMAEDPQ